MAGPALQAPESQRAQQPGLAATAARSNRAGARVGALGNQARLRRLAAKPARIQAKLHVGAANDPLERQADEAADAVMRRAAPAAAMPTGPQVQRKCAGCLEQENPLRRTAAAAAPASAPAPAIVHEALSGPGHPLDAGVRGFMETGFGTDFAAVRVHTGPLATQSARAVGARAYTIGADIVFGEGQYEPDSMAGRRLLAHELTHTLQQGAAAEATLRRHVTTPSPGDAAEVAGEINGFCPKSAVVTGSSLAAAGCEGPSGDGCECACSALQDTKRTYIVAPRTCAVKMAKETLFDGTDADIPESTVYPNTLGPPCGTPITIEIRRPGSAMEFGAFKADGTAFWYDNPWRILAHELCGHGVKCQSYKGETGNREEHDVTIDTENKIAGGDVRGHYGDKGKGRQGESFMNKVGDRTKVAFKLKDGWHFEAP